MTLFETAATAHCKAIYDALVAAETANPGSAELATLHSALLAGMDDLALQHPGIVRPDSGGVKTP